MERLEIRKVVKQGNVITIIYDIELTENAKNMKKALLTFTFVDGLSEDATTNDFFTNVCRYIKD